MDVNYHTHTCRCNHAKGTERDYIVSAVNAGLKVIGMSDHGPYRFPDGYYSGHRMKPYEIYAYTSELLKLREEFKNTITIYIGYELEYYPAYFDDTIKMIGECPYDYLILGQHFMDNEIGGWPCCRATGSTELFDRYISQVIEGLRTGKFFYLCHPDMFNFTGDVGYYKKKNEELCMAAKEMDIPLEINMLGIRGGRHYPRDEFWEVAGAVGNKVILGCDAHRPEDVGVKEEYEYALKYASGFGLEVIAPERPVKQR